MGTRRRLLIALPGLLALLAAAACTTVPAATGVPASTVQHAPRPAGSAATQASASAAAQASASAAAGTLTLAFAGDVHFTGRTAGLLNDPATAFGPVSAVLRAADFTAVNLETAVTSRGTPQPKTYHFRTGPAAFTALRDAGVDLVTMANNHVLDYGQAGLADTLAAARAKRFPYVGIGTSAAAAWAPYVTTLNGTRIAVIGVSQVAELASSWVATARRPGETNAIDLRRTLAAVRAARRLAPVVIVFMHWGTEGEACPDPSQRSLARKLAAAGVKCTALHADRSQDQRRIAVEGFKGGRYKVLVATDIAARGLDIDAIHTVINYEVPDSPDAYVHRVGRTGRADAVGQAITLVSPEERHDLAVLAKAVGLHLE